MPLATFIIYYLFGIIYWEMQEFYLSFKTSRVTNGNTLALQNASFLQLLQLCLSPELKSGLFVELNKTYMYTIVLSTHWSTLIISAI